MKNKGQISFIDIAESMVDLVALKMHGSTFNGIEVCLVAAIMRLVESRATNIELFLATKHSIICNPERSASARVLECIAMFDVERYFWHVSTQIVQNFCAFVEIATISCLCILAQALLFSMANINLKRKMFHFFAFLVFYREHRVSFVLAECLLLILGIVSSSGGINSLFKPFLSRHDRGKAILSHFYLLAACVYPRYFVHGREYVCTLISVCFLDSMASIVGGVFRAQSKSAQGTVAGIVSGTLVYFLMYRETDMALYFVCMGLVERIACANDNLTIPLASIVYFRARRWMQ